MIDHDMYQELHSDEDKRPPAKDDLEAEQFASTKPPKDPFVFILPATIPGFQMENKKWSKNFRDLRLNIR